MMYQTRPLLFLILCFAYQANGQICDGNIGENIFTAGDFGSGTANVLLPDPQIAPGYSYQANPPPNDGFYTITNNTGPWGSFASNWANIQDNSSDPNGYMMVVNASYDPGLFYEQQVGGLCENTLYVFTADIYNLLLSNSGIKPNVSFLLNGMVEYSTGDIAADQQWKTYGFTFTTGPGQTALTLAISNNAPGGGGNDLALDNITFRPCGPEALILPMEIANICEDGSPIELEATILGNQYDTPNLQWQQSFDGGLTWVDIPGETNLTYTHTDLSGGFYYYRYLLANDPGNLLNSKCRVVSNIKVVHVIPKFYTIVDTLCEGLSFELGNNLYTNTGIYVDSFLTSIGCDSIVTLDLTIVPDLGVEPIFNTNNPSCHDLEDGSISIDTILNGTGPYLIFVENDMALFPAGINNLGEGNYNYEITDHYGCHTESTVILQTPNPFTVELGPDLSVELGESIQVIPFLSLPASSYSWEPASLIDCSPDCESLNWVPPYTSNIYLTVVSDDGCIATDSLLVNVEVVRKVFIPNAFSPNNDGINDIFTIYGAQPNVQRIEELVVFDRWGGMVFHQNDFLPNDSTVGWDGTARGEPLDAGIYTWFARIRFLDEEVILFEGNITLIK